MRNNEISLRVLNTLGNANISLDSLRDSSAEEILSIKGIGKVALVEIQQYFTSNTATNSFVGVVSDIEPKELISAYTIAKVRHHFENQAIVDLLAKRSTPKYVRALYKEFFTNDALDARIAKLFSNFTGTELLSTRTGQLHRLFPRYHNVVLGSAMDEHLAYYNLIQTLFNGLVELDVLHYTSVVKTYMVNGRRTSRTELNITYPGEQRELVKDLARGVHNEPGIVMSKRVTPKPGGKAIKYSSSLKSYLAASASKAVQLIDISEEDFFNWGSNSKWYIEGCLQQSRAALKEQLQSYWNLYLELKGKPLYLSVRADYRYRVLYDFVNTMLGVHTKDGKYLYEAVTPRVMTSSAVELLISFAVSIATGNRSNIKQALAIWSTDRAGIESTLLDRADKPYGESRYEERLVQAIRDGEAGVPSRFLAAGDHTNGGGQTVAANFSEQVLGNTVNIGGLETYQDFHQNTADAFGMSRKQAKDSINQSALHGGSVGAMAKTLKEFGIEMSVSEAREHLIDACGDTIVNLESMNNAARSYHDNYNPSLFFRTLDGLLAQSCAFIERVPFKVYGLSMEAKSLFTTRKMVADMPLKLSNTGEIIWEGLIGEHVSGEMRAAATKMSGAVANVIHSVDGWNMRDIKLDLIAAGYEGLDVYDMYLYQPDAFIDIIIPKYRVNVLRIQAEQPMTKAIVDMRDNRNTAGWERRLPVPKFIYGDLTPDDIRRSNCMISS